MMNYEEPRDVQAGIPQLVGTVEDSNVLNNSTSISVPGRKYTSSERKVRDNLELEHLILTNKE
jgi:hypothetical protein